MIYRLRSKGARSHHIDHFLRRVSGEYEVLERIDGEGTATVRIEGELPGYPPVLVEAVEA